MQTKQHLAAAVGVPYELLDRRAFTSHQQLLYTRHEFPKRDGSKRLIHTPHWPLMNIQSKIADLLVEAFKPSSRATGYIKGRGIVQNASLHLGKRLILNIDLKDFFPTIHFGRIRGRLMANPYGLPTGVATTIARLCTLDGTLPIGSPSSPVISNIICSHLDGALTSLAREHGCFYSRYADDITFSTNRRSFPASLVRVDSSSMKAIAGELLQETVSASGFEINPLKTRLLDKRTRQEITGVVINEFMNVRRPFLRELRGALNAWEKYGHADASRRFHENFNWRKAQSFENNLRGRINHLLNVRGADDLVVWKYVARFNQLPDRAGPEIAYIKPRDLRSRLTSTVCRVECGDDEAQVWTQGSGIKLPSGAVLTNYHNVEINGQVAPSIEVFLNDITMIGVQMRVVRHDPVKDVAILEPIDTDWRASIASGATELSFSECQVGDRISVGGYPSYLLGDTCQIASGEVHAFSRIENVRYFRVSVPIIKGNSGGPVFNSLGQVIGIASRGIDTHEITNVAFNGCLELFRIEKFIRG